MAPCRNRNHSLLGREREEKLYEHNNKRQLLKNQLLELVVVNMKKREKLIAYTITIIKLNRSIHFITLKWRPSILQRTEREK